MGIDRPSGTEAHVETVGDVPAQDRLPPDRPGQPGSPSRLESWRSVREGERGRLEGERDYVVDDPADPGRTITDIDHIEDGVLWEEKSATNASDLQKWTSKYVVKKFASYPESAVERLRASHRDVRILLEWA